MNHEDFAKAWDELRAKAAKNKGMIKMEEVDALVTGRTAYAAGYKGMGIAMARGWGKKATALEAVQAKAQIKADKALRRAED